MFYIWGCWIKMCFVIYKCLFGFKFVSGESWQMYEVKPFWSWCIEDNQWVCWSDKLIGRLNVVSKYGKAYCDGRLRFYMFTLWISSVLDLMIVGLSGLYTKYRAPLNLCVQFFYFHYPWRHILYQIFSPAFNSKTPTVSVLRVTRLGWTCVHIS